MRASDTDHEAGFHLAASEGIRPDQRGSRHGTTEPTVGCSQGNARQRRRTAMPGLQNGAERAIPISLWSCGGTPCHNSDGELNLWNTLVHRVSKPRGLSPCSFFVSSNAEGASVV